MADINTLLGMDVSAQGDMSAMAEALRRQQTAGNILSLSGSDKISKMGGGMSSNATDAAKRAGAMRSALVESERQQGNTDRQFDWGQQQFYTQQANAKAARDLAAQHRAEDRKNFLSDKDLDQQYRLEHAAAQKGGKTPSKFGEYKEYKDPEGNIRNVTFKDGQSYVQDAMGNPLKQPIVGWKKYEKGDNSKGEGVGGTGQLFGTAAQQKEFEERGLALQNQSTVFQQFDQDYANNTIFPKYGTIKNFAAAELGMLASDEMKASQRFWRDYDKIYTLQERNRLFGSALTEGENRSWKAANIGPDMTPEQIEEGMFTLNYMARKDAAMQRQLALTKGRDPEYVEKVFGWAGDFQDLQEIPESIAGDPEMVKSFKKATFLERQQMYDAGLF